MKINNVEIKIVKSCKYLGVYIDAELTWNEHILYVRKKIACLSGIFYKIRHKMPKQCLIFVYCAMVHPHIQYGIELYVNTSKQYLKPLMILNNKILRILQSERISTHEQKTNSFTDPTATIMLRRPSFFLTE